MGWLQNRRERQAALVADLVKANLATAAASSGASVSPVSQNAQPAPVVTGGFEARPMARLAQTFGGTLGPATPLTPAPINVPRDDTGRAAPRRWEAPVAWNLDLTTRRTPWTVLKALADQCDVIHRCIEIRTAEITGMDWDFTFSDHAISQIMADQKVGHAKAADIARDVYGAEIDRLKAFWEQPMPGYTFAEWMVEFLWNHYVLDAVPVYPECNLQGQVTGLLIVDGSTIKPLLDNRGMRPRPPAPAYQQILWGFPRGEYAESDPSLVAAEFVPDGTRGERLTDQMAYFVRNRRTWDPYGFSTVEECIPAATLYLGRQRWLNAEYSEGATPATWMKSDSDFGNDVVQLAAYERVMNDMLSGNTGERKRIKLLPKGFEPHDMPQIDERYKPEYDEMIIKQIGSKFGVAPTQLGVIPRTGLGGRGQQQGEQDQADTVSQQPTEEWLIDVINHLCRRFLGGCRQVTATFNGGDNADVALKEAQRFQIMLSSGQTTINNIAARTGQPTFDMPEADEPMIITDKGPVFLRGTLDAQLNPPPAPVPPPPDGAKVRPGAGGGDQPPGDVSTDDDLPDEQTKAAEVAAYRRFVAKGPRSREFTWHHHTPLEVALITKSGEPDPKGPARPGPGGHREKLIVDHYRPLLSDATRLGINPTELVDRFAKTHPIVKDAIGGNDAAISAWLAGLQLDTATLRQLIDAMHTDGYLSGAQTGLDQLSAAGAATISTDLTDAVSSIDWSNWAPGDPDIASLLAGGDADGSGLAQLLAHTDTTIQGLTQTTLNRLGTILANGVANGDNTTTIASAISDLLGDPSRAEMIAVTETNRAMSLGTLDQYAANGVQGFDVVNANPCPLCAGEEEDNPHPLGDDPPPYHPRCRCAISPVLILPDGSEVDDSGDTADFGE